MLNSQFPTIPPQASEFAIEYDIMFWYVTLIIGAGTLFVYGMLTVFCFVYAQKGETPHQTPRILGSVKLEVLWTVIPLLLFMTFFFWGVKLYNDKIQVPTDAPEYYVVGKQWMWKMQHPSGQREINELHLPLGRAVKITGTSEDVIHDFGIPAFRSKFDVVPGRYTSTWYKPTQLGTYHIFCDQYCGQGHSQMVGKVHVISAEDYEGWLQGTYRYYEGKNPVDGSASWEGRKLFLKLQCNGCHNSQADARAPRLEQIAGMPRPLQGGEVVIADDGYLRESIRNPNAKIVDGWKPIMPAYPRSQVSESELLNLIAYIKSLRYGDLPDRNDRFPAPVNAPGAPTAEGGLSK